MDYREIDFNEWIRSGEGGTATGYVHKTDPGIMLKVFSAGITGDGYAEKEFGLSRRVEALGLRTPRALEIVKAGDCTGIIYQRIVRKSSFSRLCVDHPKSIERYAEMFASECKALHGIASGSSDFPSRKEQVLKAVEEHKGYRPHTKKVMTDAIVRLGDHCTCLHGDMQPGNLLMADEDIYWIDLGSFSYGNPLYDIACLYFFCKHPIGLFWGTKLCHMTRRQMNRFWESFAAAYSDSPEELAEKAKENVLVYLAYTIGLQNYQGLTAAVFDAYLNTVCLFRR